MEKELEVQVNNHPLGVRSNTKEMVIAAMLIAIGAVLRMVSPSIAGITPNWVIAMYCLAILLMPRNLRSALMIGLIAGVVSMLTSKSPVPYINLISEPVGAMACYLIAAYLPLPKIKQISLKPLLAAAIGTLASGVIYLIINKIVLGMPLAVIQAAFVSVVLPVTLFNAIIAQLLYLPARKVVK